MLTMPYHWAMEIAWLPASYRYDYYDVPADAKTYDYGFKMKQERTEDTVMVKTAVSQQ